MTKKILIVTHSGDLHADLLEPLLHGRGHRPFRINLDHFPRDYQLTQHFGPSAPQSLLIHLPTGQRLALEDVGATWIRKPAPYAFVSSDLSAQEQAYAQQETDQAMFGWLYCLDCFWMSHPMQMRGAIWKAEQLKRAERLGFRVPRSLITNCPETVREFKARIGSAIIFKSLSSPHLAADQVSDDERVSHGLPTTLITDELLGELDGVQELPCHFQEYIPKQYELRITLIGDALFAAKIHSQDDPRTQIDSRDMSAPIRYQATELPPSVAERCRYLMRSYGLNYSALDLIVTPSNEYVFLENNPNGQFLYVEQLVPEFGLMQCLADTLVKEAQWRSQ
ncbi:MvdC/MvdD family ATP grasp protein [Gallaecimonas pentaromativorans]|uniref:MvdC/MvdD family ATP grasp protein n=1 Tax=Gallaecimonas pentaromativorans TaxID=584787 RepID=UPI003A8D68CC